MYSFPFVKKEVDALRESDAKIAVVTGLPEYLLSYGAYSLSKSLAQKVRLVAIDQLDQLENYAKYVESGSFSSGIVLRKNDVYDLNKLSDIGYERVDRVWNRGEYSLYGDVAVVWPQGYKQLLRISLFDKDIEEISLIDAESRRKLEEVSSIYLEDIQQHEDIENISSVERYIEGAKLEKDAGLEFVYIKGVTKVEAENIPYPTIDLRMKSIPLISQIDRSEKVLEELIRKYVRDKYDVILIDEKRDRYDKWEGFVKNMAEFTKLSDEELDLIPKGFIDENARQVVLTPFEVFGEIDLLNKYQIGIENDAIDLQKESIEKDLLKSNEELFKKIRPGNFVVHEDHGIGKYQGIVERLEGVFIEVSYAGKDKLFIPLNQSRKVTKYIGGKSDPKLTTLNSGAWRRVRKRAEEDAEKLASELIKLYAVRKTVRLEKGNDIVKVQNIEKFIDHFQYQDTEDQAVATDDILRDLRGDRPMDRLLIGDVGFGKTEVAMRGIYANFLNGSQTAFLAPTTILVQQHRAVLEDRMEKYGLKVAALSRFLSSSEKAIVIEKISKGEIDIIVGTHSLLSDKIKFKDLGLIVIDEEQKFGVKQKEILKEKRLDSHVLSMSATPIPRTLNMALSGIRDISSISTPPHGRRPIMNKFMKFDWKGVNAAIRKELDRGGQVYFVHNRVNTIEDYYLKLKKYFPDHRVEFAHGQMDDDLLEEVMYQLGEREIDILVCTTIIENGIDMPNVNTLVVNRSEMFGLSQLYQLRGRIGRSDRQAYAYFMYDKLRGVSGQRLDALDEASDLGSGLIVASRDMEIRGVGDILGREQSGAISSVGYGMFINLLHEKILEMKSTQK